MTCLKAILENLPIGCDRESRDHMDCTSALCLCDEKLKIEKESESVSQLSDFNLIGIHQQILSLCDVH